MLLLLYQVLLVPSIITRTVSLFIAVPSFAPFTQTVSAAPGLCDVSVGLFIWVCAHSSAAASCPIQERCYETIRLAALGAFSCVSSLDPIQEEARNVQYDTEVVVSPSGYVSPPHSCASVSCFFLLPGRYGSTKRNVRVIQHNNTSKVSSVSPKRLVYLPNPTRISPSPSPLPSLPSRALSPFPDPHITTYIHISTRIIMKGTNIKQTNPHLKNKTKHATLFLITPGTPPRRGPRARVPPITGLAHAIPRPPRPFAAEAAQGHKGANPAGQLPAWRGGDCSWSSWATFT